MPYSDYDISKNLKSRVIFSLLAIAFMLSVLFSIKILTLTSEDGFLEAVNMSGRQRMLSQRIALLSNDLAHNYVARAMDQYKRDSLREKIRILDETIKLMATSHQFLSHGAEDKSIPEPSKELYDFYFSQPVELDRHVTQYLSSASSVLAFAQKFLEANTLSNADIIAMDQVIEFINNNSIYSLLPKLDQAVRLHQNQGQDFTLSTKTIEIINILMALFMLLIIWQSIFVPMQNKLAYYIKSVETLKLIQSKDKTRLQHALEGTSTGIWDWDITIGYCIWNNILHEILGLDYSEDNYYTVDDFQDMLHNHDRAAFNMHIQQHLKSNDDKSKFQHEARIKRGDGTFIWGRFTGRALWDDNGRATRMIGSFEDITTRKQAEFEKNLYISGINACNISFAIIDLDHPNRNFKYVSEAYASLTQYSSDELKQTNLNAFTGPKTQMSDLDKIDYAMNHQQAINFTMVSYRKDGMSFWNQMRLFPLPKNKNDDQNYVFITFEDVTQKIDDEKNELSRQRTESLGNLAASVAHEINNLLMPMTMAKGVLEGELRDDCDPFAIEQIEMIDQYAHQAKEIVQGILTFSRKQNDDLKLLNIANETNSAVDFIQNLIPPKIALTFHKSKDKTVLSAMSLMNDTEMKQIITNLCRNAEDAMSGDNGTITISMDHQILDKKQRNKINVIASDFVVIKFEDTGQGIPQQYLNQIFEPLFTTKDVGNGTGLGLSVIHGILRSWGGAITVESIQGRGTTFNLYIPIENTEGDFTNLLDLLED